MSYLDNLWYSTHYFLNFLRITLFILSGGNWPGGAGSRLTRGQPEIDPWFYLIKIKMC